MHGRGREGVERIGVWGCVGGHHAPRETPDKRVRNEAATIRHAPDGNGRRLRRHSLASQPTHEESSMSNDRGSKGALHTLAEATTSRRSFLRTASLTAAGAGAPAACGKTAAGHEPAARSAG